MPRASLRSQQPSQAARCETDRFHDAHHAKHTVNAIYYGVQEIAIQLQSLGAPAIPTTLKKPIDIPHWPRLNLEPAGIDIVAHSPHLLRNGPRIPSEPPEMAIDIVDSEWTLQPEIAVFGPSHRAFTESRLVIGAFFIHLLGKEQ